MRKFAGTLRSRANGLRNQAAGGSVVLEEIGRWLPLEQHLSGVAGWMDQAAADIEVRATELEAADRLLHLGFPFGIGFEFDIGSLVSATPDRIRRLEGELTAMQSYPHTPQDRAAVVRELRELRERRIAELGILAIVDPSIERSPEFDRVARDLGVTHETIDAVIRAMDYGLGPDEAGIPAVLFPPEYRTQHRDHVAPLVALVDDLEHRVADRRAVLLTIHEQIDDGASYAEIIEEFGEFPIGVDLALHEANVALGDARRALDDARDELAREPLESIRWLVAAPFARALVAPVVGQRLADELLDDSRRLEPIALILAETDDVRLDRAFYEDLGAAGASMIPTWIAHEADYGDRNGTRSLLRSFSDSLGRAAYAGLSFSGGDVVWPDDPNWLIPPAELLRDADFPTDFLVDAAALLTRIYGEHFTPFFSTGPIVFAPGPEFNDDPRSIVLEKLTGPDAAEALFERLIAGDLVASFVTPHTPYGDGGWDVAAVMAGVRGSEAAVAALIETIAESGGVDDPIALGGATLLDGNMSLLVPTGAAWDADVDGYSGVARFDYDHDPRIGVQITEVDIDRFLAVVLESEIATAALMNDFGAYVRTEMAAAPTSGLQDRVDELGAAAGRIVRIRNDILIERGASADDRLAFVGLFVSVMGGVAISVGTGGLGTVAAVTAGAGGDLIIDAGFDHFFAADHEAGALRAALGDDTFGLEVWRYLVVEAVWETDPSFFGSTPPPVEMDGTLSSLSGPTVGDAACFLGEWDAGAEWYAWLRSLPDDLQAAIDSIADTAHSRMAEEARLRASD